MTAAAAVAWSPAATAEDEYTPASVIERPKPETKPREPEAEPKPPRKPPPKADAPPPEEADDLDARLQFLEERIDRQRTHAEIWWGSWLTFYTVGAIVQGARAGIAEEEADQADLMISSLKATAGALRKITDPYGGIQELDPAPAPRTTRQKAERVRKAEKVLEHNAEATEDGRAWYVHAGNAGVNLVGAVIVAVGFGDPAGGFISAGIGFAVGEISIFTGPWEADDDLALYRERFGKGGKGHAGRSSSSQSGVTWSIHATDGGGMLDVRF